MLSRPAMDNAAPDARRRPWFLILALVVCSILGAGGFIGGMETVAVYRTTQLDTSVRLKDLKEDGHRQAAQASVDHLVEVLEQERPKMFPLSVGELVLGLAMFILAAGAMAGRGGARRALVQVTLVQAALIVGTYVATPKVRVAASEMELTIRAGELEESGNDPAIVKDTVRRFRQIEPVITGGVLGGRMLVALLIVVALTRKRTRAFYEAMSEQRNAES